jgi:hypothetical protein
MRRRRLFEMLREGARTCWPQFGFSARLAAGRLAHGWSVIPIQQTGKDLADLAVNRRVDSTRCVLALPPCHGRIFNGFLVAVDHLMRLVGAIAFLVEQFRFHGGTPPVKEPGRRESGGLNHREGGLDRACKRRAICRRGDNAFLDGHPTAEYGYSLALLAAARPPGDGVDAVEHIARRPAATAFTSNAYGSHRSQQRPGADPTLYGRPAYGSDVIPSVGDLRYRSVRAGHPGELDAFRRWLCGIDVDSISGGGRFNLDQCRGGAAAEQSERYCAVGLGTYTVEIAAVRSNGATSTLVSTSITF